jgi:hypothetical protein
MHRPEALTGLVDEEEGPGCVPCCAVLCCGCGMHTVVIAHGWGVLVREGVGWCRCSCVRVSSSVGASACLCVCRSRPALCACVRAQDSANVRSAKYVKDASCDEKSDDKGRVKVRRGRPNLLGHGCMRGWVGGWVGGWREGGM